ncbi:MAG: hypothetical protein ACRDZ7_07695, partial [Acidimicrobiia bacterium]
TFFTAVPFLDRMSWRTPDTYQKAGLRRGTATSTPTRPGTTPRVAELEVEREILKRSMVFWVKESNG